MSEMISNSGNGSPPVLATRGLPVISGSHGVLRPHVMASNGQAPQIITAQFVLHALRQWWKVATPCGLLLAVAGALVVYLMFRPVYEAVAWIKIDDSPPYVAFQSRDDSRRFAQTQMELMRSPLVLGPVVSQPEIARLPELQKREAPIEWLARNVKVAPVGQSELYRVTFQSKNPEGAAKIVNAVVDVYFSMRSRSDSETKQRVIELLEEERDRRAKEVEQLRAVVRDLTKQANPDATAAKAAAADPTRTVLAELQGQMVKAEVERQMLQIRLAAWKESIAKQEVQIPEAVIRQAVEQHPAVVLLKTPLMAKQARYKEMVAKLVGGENNEACRRLAEEIKRDEEALESVRKQTWEEVKKELEEATIARRKDELAEMETQLESQRLLEKLLQERYNEQIGKRQQISGESLELEFKRDELARAEKVFDLIAQRALQLKTEQRAPERVTLLRRAETPVMPVEMFPVKAVTVVSLAGLLLPFGIAVLWERLARRVSDSQQVEEHLNVPVLAEIARLPVRTGRSGKSVRQELSVFEESVDGLRTALILSEPLKDARVVAVTSAVNAEGKTSVALQLAVSIARASGDKVALVDGDMRSPDIHRVLGLPLSPGLAEVLAGECKLEDAIVSTWSNHVHIVPAGRLKLSPHKLLNNGNVKSVLEQLRQSYSYVVIDTPPVLPASESLVLARAADVTLVCTMRDVSRVDQVRKSYDRLMATGARPAGIVLNGVPTRQYAYRYGTYAYSRNW
jgi:succinoglycan biosynthesis transport protein ExoP